MPHRLHSEYFRAGNYRGYAGRRSRAARTFQLWLAGCTTPRPARTTNFLRSPRKMPATCGARALRWRLDTTTTTRIAAQQALAWFTKAKSDTLLGDYVLYWTAQTQRCSSATPKHSPLCKAIEHDYPNTAMKEQFLEALAPTAIDTGHRKPLLRRWMPIPRHDHEAGACCLLRAQAYKAARQNARAAKDYQLLYYKNPLSDEGKTAATGAASD